MLVKYVSPQNQTIQQNNTKVKAAAAIRGNVVARHNLADVVNEPPKTVMEDVANIRAVPPFVCEQHQHVLALQSFILFLKP